MDIQKVTADYRLSQWMQNYSWIPVKSKDNIVLASGLRWCVNAAIAGRQLLYGVLRIELPGVLFGQYPEFLEG